MTSTYDGSSGSALNCKGDENFNGEAIGRSVQTNPIFSVNKHLHLACVLVLHAFRVFNKN